MAISANGKSVASMLKIFPAGTCPMRSRSKDVIFLLGRRRDTKRRRLCARVQSPTRQGRPVQSPIAPLSRHLQRAGDWHGDLGHASVKGTSYNLSALLFILPRLRWPDAQGRISQMNRTSLLSQRHRWVLRRC